MAKMAHYADRRAVAIFLVVLLILVGSLTAVYVDLKSDNASLSSRVSELQRLIQAIQANQASNLSAVPVYNHTRSAVVLITTDRGEGSGFVYDSQGHIVTNNHVVQGANAVNVSFSDGSTETAQIVGTPDVYSDLALIKVDELPVLSKPLQIRNSTQLKIGETVYAVGNPFGLKDSMTMGIVSQLERVKRFSDLGEPVQSPLGNYSMPDIIQFDAAVNTGSSGGPLLDSEGHVVGVTFAIETGNTGVNGFMGIGYAIPSIMVMRVIPALESVGHYDHPWVGIEYDLHYANGTYVTGVVSSGPADTAGLRAGDIIEQVNSVRLNNGEDFSTYLERYESPGSIVSLKIGRDNSIIDKTLTLGKRNSAYAGP